MQSAANIGIGSMAASPESISLRATRQSRRAAMRLIAAHIHQHCRRQDRGYLLAKNARVLAPPRPR